MKITHELKTWPKFFSEVAMNNKKFEVRKNDRNYKLGDELLLKEWSPTDNSYTGRKLLVVIDYILEGGQFGILDGYCCMSIDIIDRFYI